jgi:predicted nuclease of predicted toxin-antitoxin system
MKLLFDANLSPDLVQRLRRQFPDSAHVRDLDDLPAVDLEIWDHAMTHGYTIVTKDADFDAMSQMAAHSPKIVWIRRGNCSTDVIEQILLSNAESIYKLGDAGSELSMLILL